MPIENCIFAALKIKQMSAKRELRFFNTTCPCNTDDHYMLPPADRLVGAQLKGTYAINFTVCFTLRVKPEKQPFFRVGCVK